MRVLLLSAYDVGSHQLWRESLQSYFFEWAWTVCVLPPRHFSWRMRGNALQWFLSEPALKQNYDMILATSMVDLASLKGLCPNLLNFPSVLYFHENQFAYPQTDQQHSNIELQLLSVYAAFAAFRLVFDSRYNMSTFFEGVHTLFRRLPDRLPAESLELLQAEAQVLPVSIAVKAPEYCKGPLQSPLQVVWNHRWEYDKAPERLLAILKPCPRISRFVSILLDNAFGVHLR